MNKNKGKNNRIAYLDGLRACACLAVVAVHIAAQNWGIYEGSFNNWNVFNIWEAMTQWIVPSFIMISGALMLDRDKNLNIRKLYTKNIFRIITVFLVWSFAYALFQVHFEGGGFDRVLALTLEGHYHMWYLFMIVALYMLTPLIRKLSDRDMEYLLLISFIICFVLPTLFEIKNAILPFIGSEIVRKVLDQIFVPYTRFRQYLGLGYITYYVLGHILHVRILSGRAKKIIFSAAVISFFFTIAFSGLITYLNQKPYGIYDIFTVNILAESIGMFVFLKELFEKKEPLNDQIVKPVNLLADCSFGVYLIHPMILETLNNVFSINTLSFNPWLSVPVITVIVFLISITITVIIKKIPKLGRILV